jgi:hypothetical protein
MDVTMDEKMHVTMDEKIDVTMDVRSLDEYATAQ